VADETAGGSPRQSRVWSTCSRHSSESRRAPGATLSSDSQVPSFAGLNAAADPIFIRRGWPATRPSSLSPGAHPLLTMEAEAFAGGSEEPSFPLVFFGSMWRGVRWAGERAAARRKPHSVVGPAGDADTRLPRRVVSY